jgi:hypothetical protein
MSVQLQPCACQEDSTGPEEEDASEPELLACKKASDQVSQHLNSHMNIYIYYQKKLNDGCAQLSGSKAEYR